MNTILPRIPEETQLVEFSENGRSFQLHPEALGAWEEMKTKAISHGVQLRIFSAFRSVHRQAEIIDGFRLSYPRDNACGIAYEP